MQIVSIFIYVPPTTTGSSLKLRPVKTSPACPAGRPSPLEPKKLNFYCTLGLEGGFNMQDYAAEFANYDIDSQLFRKGMVAVKSINKNNVYNSKNFQFGVEISKNGGVISKNFQDFSSDFQEISNFFQSISNGWVI